MKVLALICLLFASALAQTGRRLLAEIPRPAGPNAAQKLVETIGGPELPQSMVSAQKDQKEKELAMNAAEKKVNELSKGLAQAQADFEAAQKVAMDAGVVVEQYEAKNLKNNEAFLAAKQTKLLKKAESVKQMTDMQQQTVKQKIKMEEKSVERKAKQLEEAKEQGAKRIEAIEAKGDKEVKDVEKSTSRIEQRGEEAVEKLKEKMTAITDKTLSEKSEGEQKLEAKKQEVEQLKQEEDAAKDQLEAQNKQKVATEKKKLAQEEKSEEAIVQQAEEKKKKAVEEKDMLRTELGQQKREQVTKAQEAVSKAKQEEDASVEAAKAREDKVVAAGQQNLDKTRSETDEQVKAAREAAMKKKDDAKKAAAALISNTEKKTDVAVTQVGEKAEQMAQAQAKSKVQAARSEESKQAAVEIEAKKEQIEKGTVKDVEQEQDIQRQIDTVKKQYMDAVQNFKRYNEDMATKFQNAFVPEQNYPAVELQVAAPQVSKTNSNFIVGSLFVTNALSLLLFTKVYNNSKKYTTYKTALLEGH